MLDIDLIDPSDVQRAAEVFHRNGFVAIRDALTTAQFATIKAGTDRVITEQTEAIPPDQANRGHHRYSFGQQIHHPEWAMLADLPTILPILDEIWQNPSYRCMGAGGDYSLPGAEIQPLHRDMGDTLHDPLGQVTILDLPSPFIVVNFLMVDFREENGAIRFVPATHRTRLPVPTLEQEPQWMKQSIVCAPAGTAIIRDVRCWHGGTANRSSAIRPMASAGYHAPWFGGAAGDGSLPPELYEQMSERGRTLCRHLLPHATEPVV